MATVDASAYASAYGAIGPWTPEVYQRRRSSGGAHPHSLPRSEPPQPPLSLPVPLMRARGLRGGPAQADHEADGLYEGGLLMSACISGE